MECVLRLKGKRVFLSKKKKFGYIDLIEWEDIEGFFEEWEDRIEEGGSINDFSFVYSDTIHMEWIENNPYDEDDKYDCMVRLDLDLLRNNKIYNRLAVFALMFERAKEECQDAYVSAAKKIKFNSEVKAEALKIVEDYSKSWTLPYTKDTEEFQKVATWISEYPRSMIYSGKKFCTPIERATLMLFVAIAFGSPCLGFIDCVVNLLAGQNVLGIVSYIMGQLICLGVMYFRMDYMWVCNERTILDFIEEFEEYKEAKETELCISIDKKLKCTDELVKKCIMDDSTFISYHQDYNLAGVDEKLQGISSNIQKVDNLADRFRVLRELLEVELSIYGVDNRVGLKSRLEETFQDNYLANRLAYVMYYDEGIGDDKFLKSVKATINKLKNEPFYGCESEIVRLTMLACEYTHLKVRYNGLNELFASSPYKDLLKRKSDLESTIASKRDVAFRYTALTEARDNLSVLMDNSGNLTVEALEPENRLAFKQVG